MGRIQFSSTQLSSFLSEEEIEIQREKGKIAWQNLLNGTTEGNDFLGWIDLPLFTGEKELQAVLDAVKVLKENTELVVVIGIGGSYLGAKAVIEALKSRLKWEEQPTVIFAGHHLSEDYYRQLLDYLEYKNFGICVISKSGTTTEPAVAFRLLRELLEKKLGKVEAARRTIAITDAHKGALRTLANQEGYTSFVIPDNVGGRYSVLTPVGLLPIALSGFDIRQLIRGAREMHHDLIAGGGAEALEYAAIRNALYAKGYLIEILVNYNPALHSIAEWWKQLFGESEGKAHKGLFPASVDFTTDLHSMGQYIQEGPRHLFETVLSVEQTAAPVVIPTDEQNLDQLNFLAGKTIDEVNKKAEQGTCMAHLDGGVPNLRIVLPELSEYYLGQLLYFFELACGISGGILGVNAFNQPGVEAYKKNMYALLK